VLGWAQLVSASQKRYGLSMDKAGKIAHSTHTVRVDTVHLAGSGPQTPTLTLGVGPEALHLHFSPLLLAKDPLHLHIINTFSESWNHSHAHCVGHWLLLWIKNAPNDTDMGSKSQVGNNWVRTVLQIPL
jgi:hypothetical protein